MPPTGHFFTCGLPMLAMMAVLANGCDDESSDEAEPTPTDSPTPAPTQVPGVDDYFRTTELRFGTSTEGVDLDGDGTVDNGIESTLSMVNATVYDFVEQVLCGDPPDCDPKEKTLLAQIDGILDGIFSVTALSDALNQPIQSGATNYTLQFLAPKRIGTGECTWYSASVESAGYILGSVLARQTGAFDVNGHGLFGPGDLKLTLIVMEQKTQLVLYSAYTEVPVYSPKLLDTYYAGGALSLSALLEMVTSALLAVDALIPGPPLPVHEILQAVTEALLPFADVDLDGDGEAADPDDGFSVGLIGDAIHIEPQL